MSDPAMMILSLMADATPEANKESTVVS
jgi:hypothetical protein